MCVDLTFAQEEAPYTNFTQRLRVFSYNAVLKVTPWQCLSIVQARDNGLKVEEHS